MFQKFEAWALAVLSFVWLGVGGLVVPQVQISYVVGPYITLPTATAAISCFPDLRVGGTNHQNYLLLTVDQPRFFPQLVAVAVCHDSPSDFLLASTSYNVCIQRPRCATRILTCPHGQNARPMHMLNLERYSRLTRHVCFAATAEAPAAAVTVAPTEPHNHLIIPLQAFRYSAPYAAGPAYGYGGAHGAMVAAPGYGYGAPAPLAPVHAPMAAAGPAPVSYGGPGHHVYHSGRVAEDLRAEETYLESR